MAAATLRGTPLYPIIAADVVLLTVIQNRLRVLLLQRENDPYRDHWALAGSVLKPEVDESMDATARRALRVKTGVDVAHLEQVAVFSGRERDPRGYSLSVVYFALLPQDRAPAIAGTKARAVVWADVGRPKRPLAFDHATMIEHAVRKLRHKVERSTLPLHLLPVEFTLTQLQHVCEAILGDVFDKSSFRRRLRNDPSLVEIPGTFQRGNFRPAQLYRAAKDFRFQ
jgi:ADP-ribose pyrophosphatase YjhB (NUDIX family)